jgi:Protein of unknown function (DUF1566)/SPOR domain
MNIKTDKIFKIPIVIMLLVLFFKSNSYSSENLYYSINIDNSKSLEGVYRKLNIFRDKAKTFFWEKVEMPGAGQFYRVYVGKYKNWHEANEARQQFEQAGFAGYLGIQGFRENSASLQQEMLNKSGQITKAESYGSKFSPLRSSKRFIDNNDGTVTDTYTNLMWLKSGWSLEFISSQTWSEAIEKCEKFSHGGYDDWRLPTLGEWNSIIDVNHQNPAIIEPNPFVNIISHMPYWTKTEFNYGKNTSCCAAKSYAVLLYSGNIQQQNKTERAMIMPVRKIGVQNLSLNDNAADNES